jgi:hypothetical protein
LIMKGKPRKSAPKRPMDARSLLRAQLAAEKEQAARIRKSIERMKGEIAAGRTERKPPAVAKERELVRIPKSGLEGIPVTAFNFGRPLHRFALFPDGKTRHIAKENIAEARRVWREHERNIPDKRKSRSPGRSEAKVPRPDVKKSVAETTEPNGAVARRTNAPEFRELTRPATRESPKSMVPDHLRDYLAVARERGKGFERGSPEKTGLKRMVGSRLLSEGIEPALIGKILSEL